MGREDIRLVPVLNDYILNGKATPDGKIKSTDPDFRVKLDGKVM
jgi:hypothetical protein